MDNQVTIFKVDSTRIHDIELPVGSTVAQLRAILHEGGYDVADAQATVIRAEEGDKLIGRNECYVLKKGDTVEFSTRDLDLPATRTRLKEAAARAETEAQERMKQEAAAAAGHAPDTEAGCGECRKCAGKEGETVKFAGGRIEIKTTPDGIVIMVR